MYFLTVVLYSLGRMPPKFDVLQSQNNRKNCIKQLVERIEELSHVIQQKDQRILEL